MVNQLDRVEAKTLWVTVFVNLIMALAGWYTFHLTGSQAMLLDGNFSFVLAVATVIAVFISKYKHQKSKTFPYGNYFMEAAFVLSKGLLIVGIIIAALFQNIGQIIHYINGAKITTVVLTPIYYYVGFILVVLLFLLAFFGWAQKASGGKSAIIKVELESAKIDGVLTLATGAVFFAISFIPANSSLAFLTHIGDSVIVIAMSVIMIGSPLQIIRDAFIELGGGRLQNKEDHQQIENTIKQVIKGAFEFDAHITKIGSGYFIVVYVKDNHAPLYLSAFKAMQQKIVSELQRDYGTVSVEFTFE